MFKRFFSATAFLFFLTASGFSSVLPVSEPASSIIIIDETPERITVTPLEYQGAYNVIIDVLDANDQVLSSAQTTVGHAVVFGKAGQERKVRARFYTDSWEFVIMDEENM